jgi:chitinase
VVTCDEEDGHISYHPDKANCAMYYMCEGERKHHMPCPVQLVFNPSQNGKIYYNTFIYLFLG